jgi:hypothetical protein
LSYRDKQVLFQVLFDTTGTTVGSPGSQRVLPDVLEQLFANLQVGLEHVDEAVWFEHLKIDGTKIHAHPLAPQEVPDEACQACGYDLCLRLKSFPDRRLHVPKGNWIEIPESLKDVVLADISIEDIEHG